METGNVLRHYPFSLWFNSLYRHKHDTHKISIYYPFLCPPVSRTPASCCISVHFKNLLLLYIYFATKIFPENCWYWSSDPRLQSWDCGRDWSWYRSGRDTSGYHRIWVSHYRPISLSLAGSRAWRLSRLSPVLGILTPISQSSRPLSHHRTGIPSSDQRHVRLMTHGAILHCHQ